MLSRESIERRGIFNFGAIDQLRRETSSRQYDHSMLLWTAFTTELWMLIGLRLALGATPSAVMTLIVGRGARLVAIGVVLGLIGAAAGVRLLRSQLFGVEPTDPVTWFAVAVLLLGVGLIACGIPARRAMKVAPASVLRSL